MATKTAKKRAGPQIHEASNHRLGAENSEHRQSRPNLIKDGDPDLPALPVADENGQYPAIATARVILARQIIRGRKAAGWTQAELAARAGVRLATVSRIETGQHSPALKTMAKIDRVLKRAGV